MAIDLQFSGIRIYIERSLGNVLDVAPWLDASTVLEIARTLATANQPCVSGATFKLTKAFNDPNLTESFDYRLNPRFLPGKQVTIQIYWEGQWRSPPFADICYIKSAKCRNTGTHEEVTIETHDEIGQRLEIDGATDPERFYDAQGNEVPQSRDVLGTIRTLRDISKAAYHNKGLTLIVPSGFCTQTTNSSKEYWGDTADSLLNATSQAIAYNPDRPLEMNHVAKIGGAPTVFSIPLDLSVVTPAKRLLDCTWGLYTNDLTIYEPEEETEQLAEYVQVTGVASRAVERPSVTTTGGKPPQSTSFSFNTPVNPITNTQTTTTINWVGLTIEIVVETYSTAQALNVAGGASAGFGDTLVQREVTKKIFDTRRRKTKETIERYVPDSLKLGTGSSSSIGTPAYRKETFYDLSSDDRVIGEITNETAANAITGASGSAATLGPLATSARNNQNLGQGVNISSGGMVAAPSIAQGAIPYFPQSYGGTDDRANAPQCEYFPDRFYVESKPLRRKVQITWGGSTLTKRVLPIDIGSALLTGANFDLLAASLAHLHTAQHAQHTCEFPLQTSLFTDWQTPGKVISVLESAKGKRFHYFTGGDSIEFGPNYVKCSTNLHWIGTTEEATGTPDPGVIAVVETFYLLDENDNILTDENGDRLTWS